MSLSPFDSFQSRFVTYLLNFPRINKLLLLHLYYLYTTFFGNRRVSHVRKSGAMEIGYGLAVSNQ